MATVTGTYSDYKADYLSELRIATLGTHTATQFVLSVDGYTITVVGSGFSYQGNGPNGGTITGMTVNDGHGTTSWSNLSVSAASLWAAVTAGNLATFNALLYGGADTFTAGTYGVFAGWAGDDVFNMQTSTQPDYLSGGDGNDTFNYLGNFNGWDSTDGGAGTDTINLDGDYGSFAGYGLLSRVTNVEFVHMAAGHNYYVGASPATAMTLDASAVGAANTVTIDLYGATGACTVLTGAGNDTLIDGGGNDTFHAGSGSDIISFEHATGGIKVNLGLTTAQTIGGGMGTDTLDSIENVIGSYYADTITGNDGDNTFLPGEGNDVVDGGTGFDTVWFKTGQSITNDTNGINVDLRIVNGPNVTGRLGSNTLVNVEKIIGTCRPDTFIGNAADNVFDGGGKDGWMGNDEVDYSSATGGLTLTATFFDQQSGATAITVTGGGQGTDTLLNMTKIDGSAYNDTFSAIGGTYIFFDAGAGYDTLAVVGNKANYRVADNYDGTYTVSGSGPDHLYSQITVKGIEKIQFSDQAMLMPISGTPYNDTITGTDGDDLINLAQGHYIDSDPFGGVDTAYGLGGDDVIDLGNNLTAADHIDGGDGYDTVKVYPTAPIDLGPNTMVNVERIEFQGSYATFKTDDATVAARKTLTIYTDAYLTFDGSAETDGSFVVICGQFGTLSKVTGGDGNDTITGSNHGGDLICGGKGDDLLSGGGGEDRVSYADATSGVIVNLGLTTVQDVGGGRGIDTLIGFLGFIGSAYNDTVTGTTWGADNLDTGDGDDVLIGLDGWDRLYGGAGNDTLNGGAGNDSLDGGAGADTAIFSGNRSAYTITRGTGGTVTISGTDGTDTLTHIEYAKFADQTVSVGQVARDFDGDGKSDILWENTASGQDMIWLMNGTTRLSMNNAGGAQGAEWKIITTGDFDGDGKADILWEDPSRGQDIIWLMNGATRTTMAAAGGSQGSVWKIIATGDFDGDGKSDILWEDTTRGQDMIWLMNGTTRTAMVAAGGSQGAEWKIVGTGDFDGDGKSDILWENTNNGQDMIWLMNGTTRTAMVAAGGAQGAEWKIVGTGDFDGDGKSDILWENTNTGQDMIWLMDGTTRRSMASAGGPQGTGWVIVGTGDYNGDGKSDILWQYTPTGQDMIWLMDGTTRLSMSNAGGAQGSSWLIVGGG